MNVVGAQGNAPRYEFLDSEEETKYLDREVVGF